MVQHEHLCTVEINRHKERRRIVSNLVPEIGKYVQKWCKLKKMMDNLKISKYARNINKDGNESIHQCQQVITYHYKQVHKMLSLLRAECQKPLILPMLVLNHSICEIGKI